MRVLVTGLVPTHLMPMVPLAWALRAAGHQVLVSGGAPVVERAAAAGLSGAPVAAPPGRRLPRSATLAGPPGAEPDWTLLEERWRQRVDGVLDQHLAVARRYRPDLVLCDPIEFSGLIVAAALGVPAVVHRWGPDRLSSRSVERAVDALAGVAVRHGVPGGPARPALLLDPCPPSLQCPDAAPALHVRYLPFNGAGQPPRWATGERRERRVCVSFGGDTAVLTRPAVWHGLLAALSGLDGVEACVTAVPEEGGELPPGVQAPGPVPLDLFLDSCDALVHHGGAGTALTGLAFGLPQLVLVQPHPTWTVIGERIAACGAGRVLGLGPTAEGFEPGAFRWALRELLHSPDHRAAAVRLAEEMHNQPTPAEVVPVLTELAAARATG